MTRSTPRCATRSSSPPTASAPITNATARGPRLHRLDRDAAGRALAPVDAAGLYVPGGRASYPSSLLMNAIPAKVAGVKRLAVATPTPKGETNALVLAAAHIAGVDEIWRVGGAQAVAALAYGTKRIAKVDVVTGPGNAWVAEAKRQLFGVVGIDMVAGPSEILVIADADNDPDWIAADLLSQAEHDPTSQSILITDDLGFARMVEDAVDLQLMSLPTAKVRTRQLGNAWRDHRRRHDRRGPAARRPAGGRACGTRGRRSAALFDRLRHAGSVFFGRHHARSGRRLCRRAQPRPAHRTPRAFRQRAVGARLHETHQLHRRRPKRSPRSAPPRWRSPKPKGLPAHAKSIELRLK